MTLVYLAAAWLAEMGLARMLNPPWQALSVLGLVAISNARAGPRGRPNSQTGPPVRGLPVCPGPRRGALRACHTRFDERSPAAYHGAGPLVLEGVVVGEPDERQNWHQPARAGRAADVLRRPRGRGPRARAGQG